MKVIKGYVDKVTFRNEDNGFTVMTLLSGKNSITCTGVFGYIDQGECLEIEGEEIFHNIYGKQMKVTGYTVIPASDEHSIRRYLGSGAIKGLGAVLADRIVDRFGEDTLKIIEEEPELLAEIRGITLKKAMAICEQIEEKRDMRDAIMFLQAYHITPSLSIKLFHMYGDKIYEIIKKNPYQLADDVNGIGFKTADHIARQAGIQSGADIRVKSGLCYALTQASLLGHTYLPKEELIEYTINLLGIREECTNEDGTYHMELLEHCFIELVMERKLIVKMMDKQEGVFLSYYYYAELSIARILYELNISDREDEHHFNARLERIEKNTGIQLDEMQRKAVLQTQYHGVTIITGGPGTGKTTTINVIIQMFEEEKLTVTLAAPTGRASKRMAEATGHEAKTIHRLLEISKSGQDNHFDEQFGKNEENPLDTDVIIVDEMSMVDTFLFHALLRATDSGTRIVLVGDVDQLASVGPGNILKDMIASERFSVVELTKVFRQAEESGIVTNAHKINAGQCVVLDNQKKDFLYIERENAAMARAAVAGLLLNKLPKYIQTDITDIQVLTPMRNGILGVDSLNTFLQQYINPPSPDKREREISGIIFREGDKVMQIKNNYQMSWEQRTKRGEFIDSGVGIFNGDMGVITRINNTTNLIEVRFDDDRYVVYSSKETEELELAYAITIHKSQGSEYPAVIIPLVSGNPILMTRNLLYTGVTRAKDCVCIVGRKEMFDAMVENQDRHRRYSGLRWQLIHYHSEI